MRASSFWTAIGEQLRRPEGLSGRLAGHAMTLANARANALAVEALAPRPGERFVELGCGPGQALRRILARGAASVIGIDHSPAMIAQARRSNAAALDDGRLSLAVNVAYFMQDATAIAEACRVLKPGGRLVLYVTAASAMQNWRFAGPHSHRLFDAGQLRRLIASGGFSDGRISLSHVNAGAGIDGYIVTAGHHAGE